MRQQRTIPSSFYRHLYLGERVWETPLVFYPPGLTISSCMQKGTNSSLFIQISCPWLPSGGTFNFVFDFYHVIIKIKRQRTIKESRKTAIALVLTCLTCRFELYRYTIPISPWTVAVRKHCNFKREQPASSHNPPFLLF